MSRLPVRWQVALGFLLVVAVTFFVTGMLTTSAFSRSTWFNATRRADGHLRFVLSENLSFSEKDLDPLTSLQALERPVEMKVSLDNWRLDDITASLSDYSHGVVIYDRYANMLSKYPSDAELSVPPPVVFDLLRLRYADYLYRERKEGFVAHGGHRPPPPHSGRFLLHELFFGPMGVFNIFHPSGFQHRKPWYVSYCEKLNLISGPHNDENLTPAEAKRLKAIFDREDDLLEELDKAGTNYICPPHFMRVTYEMPHDLLCLVVPLTQNGKLLGFAQMVASCADAKILLHNIKMQLVAIGASIAVVAAFMAYIISGWCLRPLDTVVKAAQRVTEGDLSARSDLPASRNEFYMLGNTFDEMIEKLENAFTEQRRFIGDASHELKTPIASLLGAAQVLRILRDDVLESPQLDKKSPQLDKTFTQLDKTLNIIDSELERMTSLVKDLLMLSRTNELSIPLSTDPINVNELIEEACQASLSGVLHRQVEWTRGADVWLLGDHKLLVRALRNLIDNALRYTPEGKRVSISFKKCDAENILIEVSDEGCGMKPEYVAQLGKRFYRPDAGRARVKGGTGLGLAITMAVVQRHGGELKFISQEGKGTRVTMRLPLPSKDQLQANAV